MLRATKFISVAAIVLMATMIAQAQRRPYQGSYQTVRQLITRIENRASNLRNNLDTSINRGRTYDSKTQQELNRAATDFQNAIIQLRSNFDRRQASTSDVQDVLNRATQIDNLMTRAQVNTRTQDNWANLRTDLSELARTFSLSWSSSDVGD
jgi:DNA anti-recombination protein RmuC